MKLISKCEYPLNICKLVFGELEDFDKIYEAPGYREMIDNQLEKFANVLDSWEVSKICTYYDFVLRYYKYGMSLGEIARRYNLNVSTIRGGIEKFLKILIKYWDINPAMPENIRVLNEAILSNTGSMELIDILRAFGIDSMDKLITRYNVGDGFTRMPGISEKDRINLVTYLHTKLVEEGR